MRKLNESLKNSVELSRSYIPDTSVNHSRNQSKQWCSLSEILARKQPSPDENPNGNLPGAKDKKAVLARVFYKSLHCPVYNNRRRRKGMRGQDIK